MTAPLDRRSYLAALLASTAGCSGWGGDGDMTTDPPAEPIDSLVAGHVVAVGLDLEETVIRTADTETPVQDALDAVADSGGRVYLPPGLVRERGPVRPHRNTGIYGFGMNVSVLQIAEANTDGILFDRDPRASRVALDGFELRGPGRNTSSGVAIHFRDNDADPVSDPADFYVGRLYCWAWNDSVYRVDEGVGPFQCRHDFLRMDDCDAGDRDALIEWRSSYGPANWFGTVVAYPSAERSGADSGLLYQRGGEITVENITTGTTTGRLVDKAYGRLHVGRLHYEPVEQRAVPDSLVRIGPGGATRINDVIVDSGAAEYAYELRRRAGNAVLFAPADGRGTIRENAVNVAGQLSADRPSWYFGSAADVDVTGRSRTGNLRVLGTAGRGMG
ncbi:glycoside hydrolase family 55 protein [Halorubrum salipaludis]|uniref:glycoside hydrolase family 55 protein n=1 Tax=Halorubrum salipaludis TaxID=2032630 RepID=UPI001E4AD781|nr:glycoside hydrolase family 55 protein [Halorubrum salipaludis]